MQGSRKSTFLFSSAHTPISIDIKILDMLYIQKKIFDRCSLFISVLSSSPFYDEIERRGNDEREPSIGSLLRGLEKIYTTRMRRVLIGYQPITVYLFYYYFTLKIDGGNLPRYYSNTINNKIKLISNFTNDF